MWNNKHNLETDLEIDVKIAALAAIDGFFSQPNIDRRAIWAAFCGQWTPARRLGLGDETRIG